MTLPQARDRFGTLEMVAVLVMVQGAILVGATVDALLFLSFTGPAGGPAVVVTAACAAATLLTAAALAGGSQLARRVTFVAEALVLLTGLVDLALALALAGGPPPLATVLTRLVLPATVLALLRRARAVPR